MEVVTIILDEKEVSIPKSDLQFFIEEKGAKEVKQSKTTKKDKNK